MSITERSSNDKYASFFLTYCRVYCTPTMTTQDILRLRLTNQHLSRPQITDPVDLVRWFGAVQAQDYPGAKWALGQRLREITDQGIEQAFTDGRILRTHVLRPTWHFVHPEDIRWLLELTGPRVSQSMASYNKKLELTDAVFRKTQQIIVEFLKKQKTATRKEIKAILSEYKIETDVQRLAHIVMQAELDQVIVSGPRRGKDFTYALFEERVMKTKQLTRDEALAELTRRYFTSHGPAQIQDFVWWSGLTTADAKHGLELVGNVLIHEELAEKIYYFSPTTHTPLSFPTSLHLLPNYDEYTVAYRDRSAFNSEDSGITLYASGALIFSHAILYQGKVIGMWSRKPQKEGLLIEPKFPGKVSDVIKKKLEEAASRYSKFLYAKVIVK